MSPNSADTPEQKLDKLIQICRQLKRENKALRDREANLVVERGKLFEQNEVARQKVENMINRLKSLNAE